MRSTFDLKHDIAKLTPEDNDDVWLLHDIIIPGTLVTAKTERSVQVERGDGAEVVGRRPVTLTLLVEKAEMAERLRLTGKIVEAPPDIGKGYHSIDVKPGTFLTVQKPWKTWEINKIRAAAKKAEPVLILVMDERDADIWLLTDREKHILHISGPGLSKAEGVSRKPEYFGSIASALKQHSGNVKHVIIAGPGFTREEFARFIAEREKSLAEKTILDAVSHTGEPGLMELLRRGTLERLKASSRVEAESRAVENLLTEIGKDGLAVYGVEQTKQAIEAGAVELLLVSDKKVRELAEVMEAAEKTRTTVMIISSQHAAGERLLGMGGIGGILRYQLKY
ncbi:MAG: mRNA surveillance protein pelota [Candidatus Aenigmatarchaeota archaeon]